MRGTLKDMKQRASGFTIVELLIVVVVIAILAVLSYVAYTNFQNRAHNTVVRQDLANVAKSLEVLKVDLGRYPTAMAEFPADLSISKDSYDQTANNVYYYTTLTGDEYALGVRSKPNRGYILTSRGLSEGVGVTGAYTAAAIDMLPANSPIRLQGFSGTTGIWRPDWALTK